MVRGRKQVTRELCTQLYMPHTHKFAACTIWSTEFSGMHTVAMATVGHKLQRCCLRGHPMTSRVTGTPCKKLARPRSRHQHGGMQWRANHRPCANASPWTQYCLSRLGQCRPLRRCAIKSWLRGRSTMAKTAKCTIRIVCTLPSVTPTKAVLRTTEYASGSPIARLTRGSTRAEVGWVGAARPRP